MTVSLSLVPVIVAVFVTARFVSPASASPDADAVVGSRYDPVGKRLGCVIEGAKPGDWVFTIAGDTMTGTLTLRKEHQLFRRSRVQRVPPTNK